MRKTVYLLSLFIFALLVQSSLAQKPPVTRFASVETIFVDRSSFRIIFTSCGRDSGRMFIPCGKANKKREALLIPTVTDIPRPIQVVETVKMVACRN